MSETSKPERWWLVGHAGYCGTAEVHSTAQTPCGIPLAAKLPCVFAVGLWVLLGGLLCGSARLPVLPLLRCIMNRVWPGNAVYPLCILNVYNSLSRHVKVITYDTWFLR